MSGNEIVCPKCGHQINLSEMAAHEVDETRKLLERQMQEELAKKEESIKKEMWVKAQAAAEKKSLEENQEKLFELEMLKKRDEESRKKETEFIKQKMEMEQRAKDMELEKQKAIMEERKKMEVELAERMKQQQSLEFEKMKLEFDKRMQEKDKQIEQVQRSLEDANRKASQGSMQIQWEIQEDAIKELLQSTFPVDIISDVEKWVKWADIVQEVRNEFGQQVGIIAWESKNTKAWSDSWVEKLKQDRLIVNANLSILVTAVLPKGISKFGLYDGVWVVEWQYVREIAMILRAQLIEISAIQNSVVWRDERLESVFNYLTSPRFKDKMENILSAFTQMQEQVTEERRAFESRWKKREQLLEQVLKNTSGFYGDLGGILGNRLEKVPYLELGSGEGNL